MSCPIELYVNVNCGLKISILRNRVNDWRDKFDQDFRSESMKYHIHYNDIEEFLDHSIVNSKDFIEEFLDHSIVNSKDFFFEGVMSPTSPLTLSQDAKKSTGIPPDAKRYAFIHPPTDLASKLKTAKTELEKKIFAFSLLGAFIYFDENNEVLCVNALSHYKTQHKFSFAGPFEATVDATSEMRSLGRACFTPLGSLHEAGFVETGWVLPNETFRGMPVCDSHENKNGAMIFYRYDNDPGVLYFVSKNPQIHPSSDCEAIREAYEATNADPSIVRSFIGESIEREKIKEWKDIFISALNENLNISNLKEALNDDGMTIIHKACHAEIASDLIKDLITKDELIGNLSYRDKLSWTPLHYACYFSPENTSIIQTLIKACPSAITVADNYGRYPLHLACQKNAPPNVISSLIEADESKEVILEKTKSLGRLPIHIACDNRKASSHVIELLLKADVNRSSIFKTSTVGHLPLHLALLNKTSCDTVKLLLNEDATPLSNFACSTIYQEANGMLPLHIACWNDSSEEIISLLLRKDDIRQDDIPLARSTIDVDVEDSKGLVDKRIGGMVALHLAAKFCSAEAVKLLLEQEVLSDRDPRKSTVQKRDNRKRCPLHVACERNARRRMIHLLLHCDPNNHTIGLDDDRGFNPIHHLACNKDAKAGTMNILLQVESEIGTQSSKAFDTRNRTPLRLAIENDMSDECIKMLLHPDHFTLEGLAPKNELTLATLIAQNKSLQREVLKTLSKRPYAATLLLQFYMNLFAVIVFMFVTDKYDYLIWVPITYYLLRELIQILSQGILSYMTDLWSWLEMALLCLLILCTTHKETVETEWIGVYIAAGFVLMMEFVSSLRATFYPIARFLIGVQEICFLLIPFFIVTTSALLAFAHSSRVYNKCETVDEKPTNNFVICLSNQFLNFLSEPSFINSPFDVMFGVLLNLIMLNVLIAIVCAAWEKSDRIAPRLFWRFRLVYISETSIFDHISKTVDFGHLLGYIDEIAVVRFWDHIEWSAAPYNVVEFEYQYKNPNKYFDGDVAAKVVNAHSLQADLYWLAKDSRQKNFEYYYKAGIHVLKYVVLIILYIILFILGLGTFGILWPVSFRLKFLTLWIPYQSNKREENEGVIEKNSSVTVRESTSVGKLAKSYDSMMSIAEWSDPSKSSQGVDELPISKISLSPGSKSSRWLKKNNKSVRFEKLSPSSKVMRASN